MRKSKVYYGVRFDIDAIRETINKLKSVMGGAAPSDLSVHGDDDTWTYDTFEEFYAAAGRGRPQIEVRGPSVLKQQFFSLSVTHLGNSLCDVIAPSRDEIEAVFGVLESHVDRCRIPRAETATVKIFVGHGRNDQWRLLKDHLHDKHGFEIEAYEIGARAGHTIRDILTYMMEGSTFALLVMTGETS